MNGIFQTSRSLKENKISIVEVQVYHVIYQLLVLHYDTWQGIYILFVFTLQRIAHELDFKNIFRFL